MAKNPDKDSSAHRKKYASFLQDLHLFHRDRGTPFNRLPRIGGKVLDLYLLYSKVTALGGWKKVTEEQRWEEIQHHFHITFSCANSAHALKQIYIRYLDLYEKINHFGQDGRHQETEDESTPVRKRQLANSATVPLSYNYNQHDVPDYLREHYGMAKITQFKMPRPFNKLEKALLSGLPNEVDFAMNVCTLLSNEGRHAMKVEQCPQVLELLIAHCGIFAPDVTSLRALHEAGWKSYTKRNFLRFWYETVSDKDARDLIRPQDLHKKPGHKFSHSSPSTSSDVDCAAPPSGSEEQDNEGEDWNLVEDVLNLGQDLGMYGVEGQRIVQFATILRNLSFETENMAILSRNSLVLRFLLLCIHCEFSTLRQLGLDTLGNISLQMELENIRIPASRLVLHTLSGCLVSADRFEVIGGLDMLSRLGQVESNEDIISEHLPEKVYEDVVRLLTVQDIHMIVSTLEALYQLSEIGEMPSTQIAMATRAVETLVSLVTVEAQSYGPSSLIGIKVVEHIPAGQAAADPVTPGRPSTVTSARPALPHVSTDPGPLTQHMLTPHAAAPSPPPKRRPGPTATPPPMDSETLACNWLQAFYEVVADHTVSKMSLYADYLTTCARCGVKGVNSNNFSNCIRVSFPSADVHMMQKNDGSSEIQYKGLKRRPAPLPFPPQGAADSRSCTTPPPRVPSRSMISSAMAQSPPPASPSPGLQHQQVRSGSTWQPPLSPSSQPPTSPTFYPTIQQALTGQLTGQSPQTAVIPPLTPSGATTLHTGGLPQSKAPDSNLIKSLLANKVNQNIQRIQAGTLAPQPNMPQVLHSTKAASRRKATTSSTRNRSKSPKSPRPSKVTPSTSTDSRSNDSSEMSQHLDTTEQLGTEQLCPVADNKSVKPTNPSSETTIEKVENQYVKVLEQELEKQAQAENVPPVQQQPVVVQNSVPVQQQQRPSQLLTPQPGTAMVTQIMPQQQMTMQQVVGGQAQGGQAMVLGQQQFMQVAGGQQMIFQTQTPQHGIMGPVVRVAQTAAEIQAVLKGSPQISLSQTPVRQLLMQVPGQVMPQQVQGAAQPVAIQPQLATAASSSGQIAVQQFPGQVATMQMAIQPQQPPQPQGSLVPQPFSNEAGGDMPLEGGSILEAAVKKAGLLGGPEGDCSTPTSQEDRMEWQSNADSEPSLKEGVGILEQAIASAGIGFNSSEGSLIDENSVPSPSALTAGLSVGGNYPAQPENGQGTSANPPAATLNGLSSPQSVESLVSEDSQPLPAKSSVSTTIADLKTQAGALTKDGVLDRMVMTQMLEDRIIREELLSVNGVVNHIGNGDCMTKTVPAKTKGGDETKASVQASVNGLPTEDYGVVAGQGFPVQPAGLNGMDVVGNSQNSAVISPATDTCDGSGVQRTSQGASVVGAVPSQLGPIVNLHSGQQQAMVQPGSVINTSSGAMCIVNKQAVASGSAAMTLSLPSQSAGCTMVMSSAGVPVSVSGLSTMGTQTIMVTSSQAVSGSNTTLKTQLNQPPKVQLVSHTLAQPMGMFAMTSQPQGMVTVAGQPQCMVTVAGQPQGMVTVTGQPQGMFTVAGQPQGMFTVAGQPQGMVTVAGQPQGMVTVAGQPQGMVTVAGQPQGMVTVAGQPQGMVTVSGQPQGMVTVAGQPQGMVAVSGQPQQMQLNVINIVSQQAQPKVLLPQPQIYAQQAQLQPKPQQLLVQTPQQGQVQIAQTSPQPAKSPQAHKRPSKSPSGDKSTPKRKRSSSSKKKSTSTDSQKAQEPKLPPPPLMCEWAGCKKCFESFKLINGHVLREHTSTSGTTQCQWEGCEGMQRARWSFIQHLQDRHLNEATLKATALRRQQQGGVPTPASSPGPVAPPPQYPADAAVQAIRRYCPKAPYPEFTDGRPEGPVTKHIRFTSALILRNLARYSALGRSLIKQHEVHLAYIALSSMEASSAIAGCLWELHKH